MILRKAGDALTVVVEQDPFDPYLAGETRPLIVDRDSQVGREVVPINK